MIEADDDWGDRRGEKDEAEDEMERGDGECNVDGDDKEKEGETSRSGVDPVAAVAEEEEGS